MPRIVPLPALSAPSTYISSPVPTACLTIGKPVITWRAPPIEHWKLQSVSVRHAKPLFGPPEQFFAPEPTHVPAHGVSFEHAVAGPEMFVHTPPAADGIRSTISLSPPKLVHS